MISFWEFITEGDFNIKMKDFKDPDHNINSDVEKSIFKKRFNIKNNFDRFLLDIKSRKALKSDNLKLLNIKRKNEGIFAENITRLIFQGENLNHFTKNHPYVDIAVMDPIDGVTKRNELISIKSTLKYKTIASILTDTKAIKFDSLLTYLIYSYNLYKKDSQPFSITELQRGLNKYLHDNQIEITQQQHKNIIYILIYHIIHYSKDFIDKSLGDFETSLISDILQYLDGELDIEEIKEFVKNELKRLIYPVSLSIVFIDSNNILNVYKTISIPLWELFFKVMNKWHKNNFFGVGVIKYLKFSDIIDIYKDERGELFPTKIHIDFSDFDNKERGNKRKRLYVSTELKDAHFDEYEEETLDTLYKVIQKLEEDPSKIKKFKKFLNDN